MKEPFFSFIIPSFNRGHLLSATLHSILNQEWKDIEVILVDDGSTDNTAEIIENFKDSRLKYFKIENAERGAARNFGMKHARGEYINFFDSDDLLLPCLLQLHNYIQVSQKPPVLFGDIEQITVEGKVKKSEPLPFASFTENLLHNNFLACGSVFCKREIILKFPFCEDRKLSSAEDWELWLRIHASYPFVAFPHYVFQQIEHKGRSIIAINAAQIETRDNFFISQIRQNPTLLEFYGKTKINLFIADRYTFIALGWVDANRVKTLHYWIHSFRISLNVIKRKRFWAVLRILLISKI